MTLDSNKILEDEIIERMMREDITFMYKVDLIKEKILTNYGEYADSIGEFNSDLDLEGGTTIPNTLKGGFDTIIDTMGLKFDTIIDAFQDLSALSSFADPTAQSESVFDSDEVNVVISDISTEAINKLTDTLNIDVDPKLESKMLDKKLKDKTLLKSVFAGIVGTAAVIGVWSKYGDDIKSAVSKGWDEHGGDIKDGVKTALKKVGGDISKGMDYVGGVWETHGDEITSGLHEALANTGEVVASTLRIIGSGIVDSITGKTRSEREEAKFQKDQDHMISSIVTKLDDSRDIDRNEIKSLLGEYKIEAKGRQQESAIKKLNQMGIDLSDPTDLRVIDEYLKTRLSGRHLEGGKKTSITPNEIIANLKNDPQFKNKKYNKLFGGFQEDEYARFFEELNERWSGEHAHAIVEPFEVGDLDNRTDDENAELFKKMEDGEKRQDARAARSDAILQQIANNPVIVSPEINIESSADGIDRNREETLIIRDWS